MIRDLTDKIPLNHGLTDQKYMSKFKLAFVNAKILATECVMIVLLAKDDLLAI
jgi:hypothetical protein